jgi:hypothetical protein
LFNNSPAELKYDHFRQIATPCRNQGSRWRICFRFDYVVSSVIAMTGSYGQKQSARTGISLHRVVFLCNCLFEQIARFSQLCCANGQPFPVKPDYSLPLSTHHLLMNMFATPGKKPRLATTHSPATIVIASPDSCGAWQSAIVEVWRHWC